MRTMIVSLLTVFLTGVTACGNPALSTDIPNVSIEDGVSVPVMPDDGPVQTRSDRHVDAITESVENAQSPDPTASYNCRPCIGGRTACCYIDHKGQHKCLFVEC